MRTLKLSEERSMLRWAVVTSGHLPRAIVSLLAQLPNLQILDLKSFRRNDDRFFLAGSRSLDHLTQLTSTLAHPTQYPGAVDDPHRHQIVQDLLSVTLNPNTLVLDARDESDVLDLHILACPPHELPNLSTLRLNAFGARVVALNLIF